MLPTDLFPSGYVGKTKFEQVLVKRWSPEVFKDAPVCVQVVTRRLEEEKCLAAMRVVKEAIEGGGTGKL